jgi:glycosyltransferase involved in cell wall biosynthesis
VTEPSTLENLPRPARTPRRTSQTLIVIPAYNESQSIAAVVREIRAVLPSVPIVVVDDGSDDGTGDIGRRAGADCLVLPFNLGVGGAMRAGFVYARERGYQVVVQVDADGQHDAAFLPALIAEVKRGADVVVGSRFAGLGEYRVPASRRLALVLVSKILSRACGMHLTDATSGFRAVSATALDLFSATYPAEYLGDTLQSLIMANRAGLVIRELPVRMRARSAGRPSQGFADSVGYLIRSIFLIGIGSQTRPERAWRLSRSTIR